MRPRHQLTTMMIRLIFVFTILILNLLATWGSDFKDEIENKSAINIADLGITGDADMCMVNGFVIGTYSAGGEAGDVYEWIITNSSGAELLKRSGGDQFETIQFLFNEVGNYTVSLKVRRGTEANFYQENFPVSIQSGATLILKPDYLLCGDSPATLYALDPGSPSLSQYSIVWKDISGNILGTGNEFLAYNAGYHFVELILSDPNVTQACSIKGTTFVGPPIDFQIIKSSDQICEGNSITLRPDTPISGEWFVKKSTDATRTSLGKAFEIDIRSQDLSGPGIYEVVFSAEYDEYPNCASQRTTTFELLPFRQVDTKVLIEPDNCSDETGSFSVTSNSNLTSIEIPELGITESPVAAGQVFTYTNLKSKVYSVIATQNGCRVTKSVTLDPVNPPTSPVPTVTVTPESCSAEGVSRGTMGVSFGESIVNGEYRLFSPNRGVVDSGTIPNSGELSLSLNSGDYFIELTLDGCTYPTESFTIIDQPQVQFTVPANFQICETFDFIPETNQDLIFTVTYPNGSIQTSNSGEIFVLDMEGDYSIKAVANDPSSPLCPQVKSFNVKLSKTFTYEPTKIEAGCVAPIKYGPNIQGIDPNETTIRWLNSAGEVVGRGVEFYPQTVGLYSLIVQPRSSGFCDVAPAEFEVVAPITSVPMDLVATPLCPDPGSAIITLTTNEDEVLTTEWNFYDLNDQRAELPEFNNLLEIEVNQPGTYEAVAFNRLGCEIGRNLIAVEESAQPQLELEETYPICSIKNNITPIDPGEYQKYEWFFGEDLVSTERLYMPGEIGEYTLVVTTVDGCVFEDSFMTEEICDFKAAYPNAMILGNSSRNFGVMLSEDITEAEVYISTRQGELIYHATTDEIAFGVPVLTWDGIVNRKYVATGNYVVVLFMRNPLLGLEVKETGTLLVID